MSDWDEQSQDLSKKKTQVKVMSDQDEQSQDQSKKKSKVNIRAKGMGKVNVPLIIYGTIMKERTASTSTHAGQHCG